MKVEIDPDNAKTVELDNRGRGYVSPDHKNETVEIVIIGAESGAEE